MYISKLFSSYSVYSLVHSCHLRHSKSLLGIAPCLITLVLATNSRPRRTECYKFMVIYRQKEENGQASGAIITRRQSANPTLDRIALSFLTYLWWIPSSSSPDTNLRNKSTHVHTTHLSLFFSLLFLRRIASNLSLTHLIRTLFKKIQLQLVPHCLHTITSCL